MLVAAGLPLCLVLVSCRGSETASIGKAATPSAQPVASGSCGRSGTGRLVEPGTAALTGITLSATSVDVSRRQPLTVTVTLDAAPSARVNQVREATSVHVDLDGPRTRVHREVLTPAGGTPTSRVWRTTVTFPRTTVGGTWRITAVGVAGPAASRFYYPGSARATSAVVQRDLSATFTVRGSPRDNPLPRDRSGPPRLVAFTLSREAVDTSTHAAVVRVTSTYSGQRPTSVRTRFLPRTLGAGHAVSVTEKRRSHNTWSGLVTFYRGITPGDWLATTQGVFIGQTSQSEVVSVQPKQLLRHHFPAGIAVAGVRDTSPPTLAALSIRPAAINVAAGSRTVTVRAVASDSLSGATFVEITFTHKRSRTRVTNEDIYLRRHGNVWLGFRVFPLCSAAGVWRVGVLMRDRAGNFRYLSSDKLRAAHLPSDLQVTPAT
jgi:hypothetical protein